MKKYVETKSKTPFDWVTFLSRNCKDMTEKELEKATKLSQSWVTCACGNQCAIIPRAKKDSDDFKYGEPLDETLGNLGSDFHGQGIHQMVNSMQNYYNTNGENWPEDKKNFLKEANQFRLKAKNILKKIEKRSAILITDEVNKAKEILTQLGYSVKG